MSRESDRWYKSDHILRGIYNSAAKINGTTNSRDIKTFSLIPDLEDLMISSESPVILPNNGNKKVHLYQPINSLNGLKGIIENLIHSKTKNSNIIIPISFGRHWISCVLKFNSSGDCTINLFNSMNSYGKIYNSRNPNYFKGTEREVISDITVNGEDGKPQQIKIEYMPTEQALCQADSFSCGPISVINSLAIAYSRTAEDILRAYFDGNISGLTTLSLASGNATEQLAPVRVLQEFRSLVLAQLKPDELNPLDNRQLLEGNQQIRSTIERHQSILGSFKPYHDIEIMSAQRVSRPVGESLTHTTAPNLNREQTLIAIAKQPNSNTRNLFNAFKTIYALDQDINIENNTEINRKLLQIIEVAKNLNRRESMNIIGKIVNSIVSFFKGLREKNAINAIMEINQILKTFDTKAKNSYSAASKEPSKAAEKYKLLGKYKEESQKQTQRGFQKTR